MTTDNNEEVIITSPVSTEEGAAAPRSGPMSFTKAACFLFVFSQFVWLGSGYRKMDEEPSLNLKAHSILASGKIGGFGIWPVQ